MFASDPKRRLEKKIYLFCMKKVTLKTTGTVVLDAENKYLNHAVLLYLLKYWYQSLTPPI
ncbi:hypothetical protein CRD36_12625 [Paremcibacter congregatus]|uniref:Uncharacterized protein n=1 Tax=Paremcibacter congregatus TaxID=2043170 RepID=A0A2G4YNY1_9PROT|nr:hypothetical protein CRD36_12625 [Paremcibacter congregatus]